MGERIKRSALYFTGPRSVEVREEIMPSLQSNQVLIQTIYSAISPGTELLIYRQQVSTGQMMDANIKSLSGTFQYPLKYGYSAVGKVIDAGPKVNSEWIGKTIFTFHPHESLFPAFIDELIEIPEGITPLDAVFLPNMETAVNFVMDGQPVVGEKVVVLGQGIVGLLTTEILSLFPLKNLITLDLFPFRRETSLQSGAQISLDPNSKNALKQIKALLKDEFSSGADLTYEISGNPEALNLAIELTGFEGRIIIGSWYGSKPVKLRLDERFHRSRIKLISSQVSTVASNFQGRWNKNRRWQTVWQMLNQIRPAQLISKHFQLTQAQEAYRLLDEKPDHLIQIIFTYPDS